VKSDSGWLLHTPPSPTTPVFFEFGERKIHWPISLESPFADEYSGIRAARNNQMAILGIAFLARLKGVVFDFTPGAERIGFIGEGIPASKNIGEGTKERVLQFIVGASLGLSLIGGWKWFDGSLQIW
jgi:hypothetical protein